MKLLLEKDKERLSYKHKKKIYARLLGGQQQNYGRLFNKNYQEKKKTAE